MKGLLSLNSANVKSAIVYALLTVSVTFIAVALMTIKAHGSIFGIDWANVVDKSATASLGVLIMFVSLLKNFLTDKAGKFLGVVEVIPETKK